MYREMYAVTAGKIVVPIIHTYVSDETNFVEYECKLKKINK